MTPTIVHWFRHDLRLSDHPSWCAAVAQARRTGARLLAVYVHDPASQAPSGAEAAPPPQMSLDF